jgi:23S rRNA (pseudouridine1915-N3)-methyltransferase
MRFRLLVVGRAAAELGEYEARFAKRLKGMAAFEVVELPEGRSKQVSQRKQEEARHILKHAHPGFILFDERGKVLGSRDWAARFEALPGNGELDFVIGGANGVSDEVRAASSACWSLSKLTLPHQLARVLVVEQLYRACSIMQGHPYHRD